jgi:hypothetical protein
MTEHDKKEFMDNIEMVHTWHETGLKSIVRIEALEKALQDLLNGKYWLEECTIPKAGIEKAPEQVIYNASLAYLKVENAKKVLK